MRQYCSSQKRARGHYLYYANLKERESFKKTFDEVSVANSLACISLTGRYQEYIKKSFSARIADLRKS